MSRLAIIGGSGFSSMPAMQVMRTESWSTPYGLTSGPLGFGNLEDMDVIFLPRHGSSHSIPPHKVNYRANIWALKQAGVHRVIGLAAVGGIRRDLAPGTLVVPNQIIDYTHGRHQTFFDGDPGPNNDLGAGGVKPLESATDASFHSAAVTHIDFTEPYCEALRQELLQAAIELDVKVVADGTYAAMPGPRLETAMEVRRLERDGCDMVGMTGMPEAALARELGLCYACCAFVVNWAAGKGSGASLLAEIEVNLKNGMEVVQRLLRRLAARA
jgi:purine nucleoside phosphorylase